MDILEGKKNLSPRGCENISKEEVSRCREQTDIVRVHPATMILIMTGQAAEGSSIFVSDFIFKN